MGVNARCKEAKVSGRRRARNIVGLAWWFGFAFTGGGCAFGPKVLEMSHGRYNEAIRQVDEEELLRNLVHMRYNETAINLTVSSIAAQYELTAGAEARPFFIAPNPSNSNIVFRTFTKILPDVTGSAANRPTITLIPSDTGDAVEKFLTPISAETLVFLAETSWPVSTVMRLWVERLNGVPNASSASGPQRDQIPDFERFRRVADLMQLVRRLRLGDVKSDERFVEVGGPLPASAVTAVAAVEAAKNGLEYRPRADGAYWNLVRKQRRLAFVANPEAIGHPVLDDLAQLLNLQPRQLSYEVIVEQGLVPDPQQWPGPPSNDLRITLRSSAQVYFFLANGVEVPPDHLAKGLVRLPANPDGSLFDGRAITADLFTVHAHRGHKPPATAFVAIRYRDYWYYIDDRDQASKETFALVLAITRLDFGRQAPGAPFLTLPVGR
jgi:hypothetical protein